MDYKLLEETLNSVKEDYKEKKIKSDYLNKQKELYEDKLSEINIDLHSKVALTLQSLAINQRSKAKQRLEELGTKALNYSMGANYEMIIDIDNTRKRPQATVGLLNTKTGQITDPLKANGGGVVDIISIALGIVTLHSCTDPIIDGPIILDEPFKMLSKEYIPVLSDFLVNISKDFERQIIMITHNNYLTECCDSIIVIEKVD